jgi:crotonobetainyl-CoA:carnitine CoA-transferase CaiB-like acyl-CoA transferase
VVKVEGSRRPDGARRGPKAFFDLLNVGKECLALDFSEARDRDLLGALIERADLVVEASRPRVMTGLGVDPRDVVRTGRTTWIAITGHGREGDVAMRVAFGDDAAFEGGCTVDEPPRFVADAVADPVAGLYAAAAGLAAVVGRRGNVIDLALARAAGYARGHRGPRAARYDQSDGRADGRVAEPRARPVVGDAAALGAHSDSLRAEFGYGRSV